MLSPQLRNIYEFGEFHLDTVERILLRGGVPVPLTPKAFETLFVLVSRNGHLIEKDELLKEVWPDTFVEEATLAQNIFTLRKVLGQERDGPQFIETVPRRGYRFIADVRVIPAAGPEIIVKQRTSSHILIEEEDEDESASPSLKETAVSSVSRVATAQYRTSLHRVALLVIALACFTGAGLYLWATNKSGQSETVLAVHSMAVLPFRPLGAGDDNELLGLGMADAVINKLSNFKQLPVLPTSAVFKYTGRETDARAAGQALGVDAVLSGTVQRAGERVRVTVQLISLRTGQMLWSDKFDEPYTNIFAIQDNISEEVARALALQLNGETTRQLAKRYTTSTDAYQDYLMGLYFYNKKSKESLGKAIEYFQQATAKDTNYALAYAVMADAYYLSLYYEYDLYPKQEAMERGRAAALKAMQLDDTLAECHTAMAMVHARYERDREAAMKSLRRAIEVNPSNAVAHQRYAWAIIETGELEEGVREMKRAQELDPLSPTNNSALGVMYLFARQYDEALKYCQRAVELNPNFFASEVNLAIAYEQKEMYREAIAHYQKIRELDKTKEGDALAGMGHALAMAGRRDEALKVLAELNKMENRGETILYNKALFYAALDEKEKAFELLEKAAEAGMLMSRDLRYDPQLDPLRKDARFLEFLQKHHYDAVVRTYKYPGACDL